MDKKAQSSIKWLISVPESVNVAVRVHLAQGGGRKGDLSNFVVDAAHEAVARRTVALMREGNRAVEAEVLQGAVRAAVAVVRAERFTRAGRTPLTVEAAEGGSRTAEPLSLEVRP
jgi:hypothetical protein